MIRFAAGGEHIAINLNGRPNPDSIDAWDRDAINATVTIRSRHFNGGLATTIWSDELWHLRRILEKLYRHVGRPDRAEWGLLEGAVTLTFELSQLGHVQVYVELRDVEMLLKFSIDADQTYLPLWIDQVTKALEQVSQAS